MKKRLFALCTLMTLLLSIFCGCSNTAEKEDSGIPSFDIPEGVTLRESMVSFAKAYGTVGSLALDSDFIGLVEITGIEKMAQEPMDTTVFSAKVLEVVYTGEETAPDTISLPQTGLKTDTEYCYPAGDPLMNPGEKWFIFARKADDRYVILGPFGRFAYGGENKEFTWLPEITMGEAYGENPKLGGGISFEELKEESLKVLK